MQFRVARASRKTGALLEQMVQAQLREMGVTPPNNAVVCYGLGYSGTEPTLNANCSKYNKLEQGKILREVLGEQALEIMTPERAEQYLRESNPAALFGRQIQHTKGKDIKIALEAWQVPALVCSGTEFFTPHVSSTREFRTWIYRRRHLGSYEKVLRRPAECKKMGRNYQNGFDFSGLEHDAVPEALINVASKAIDCLGLDFGAVDILQRPDSQYVVLEVNSAPGVSGEKRRVINNLTRKIARWAANGCKRRNGDSASVAQSA